VFGIALLVAGDPLLEGVDQVHVEGVGQLQRVGEDVSQFAADLGRLLGSAMIAADRPG
jgi:hypothetical protein